MNIGSDIEVDDSYGDVLDLLSSTDEDLPIVRNTYKWDKFWLIAIVFYSILSVIFIDVYMLKIVIMLL